MTAAYYQDFDAEEKQICASLHALISAKLPTAENKIWHAHPVWFLDGNPIVGFSKQKKAYNSCFGVVPILMNPVWSSVQANSKTPPFAINTAPKLTKICSSVA
jgi:hypothetical protein